MKHWTLLALSLVASSSYAERKLLAVLPPSTSDAAANELGYLIQTRAVAAIDGTEKYYLLHLKQILAVCARENIDCTKLDDPKSAQFIAKLLGADEWVFSELSKGDKGYTLSVNASDGKKTKKVELSLGIDASRAVVAGAATTAQMVAKYLDDNKDYKVPAAQPNSNSDAAMRALGHCYAIAVRQPMGIENPAVLEPKELEEAIASCEEALKADPKLLTARTAEALAAAILGKDQIAVKALGDGAGLEDDPLYWTARFWLVTRYQANDAGVKLLEEELKKKPSFVLTRAYLGELLDALGEHKKATQVWREYLVATPNDPFVAARLAKSLARQGQNDEAIALTKKALAIDDSSHEMRLQLASRYLDANKDAEAIAILKPLAEEKGARAEVILRLGWATLRAGKLEEAEQLLSKALAAAASPGEWRTKARAEYDLALVEAKRKKPEKAEPHLRVAFELGLKLRELDAELMPVAEKIEKADLAAGKKPVKKDLSLAPTESSLFPVDRYGEVDPSRSKPKPPDGFMLVHF